jgi:pseudouridine synthase
VRDEGFDVVVTNPPFHVGKATDLDVPQQFIADAHAVLANGGRLFLVANRTLPYEQAIKHRSATSATSTTARASRSFLRPAPMAEQKIIKYLANLGYGTRREVTQLIKRQGVTRVDGSIVRDGDSFVHDELLVDGKPLDPPQGSVIMLHKPVGYVCTSKDARQLIYELLPSRFLQRSPVMAPVGRLDRDTSGVLLVTDDGAINHRLTSPRTHVPKLYEAELASDLRGDEAELFASGTLMLDSETTPLRPAMLEVLAPRRARVVVTEGRYHQVRRMFAATGNRVEHLHRKSVGTLELGDLVPGQWRLLTGAEIAELLG